MSRIHEYSLNFILNLTEGINQFDRFEFPGEVTKSHEEAGKVQGRNASSSIRVATYLNDRASSCHVLPLMQSKQDFSLYEASDRGHFVSCIN